jgi:hypothetical protein
LSGSSHTKAWLGQLNLFMAAIYLSKDFAWRKLSARHPQKNYRCPQPSFLIKMAAEN